MTTLPSLVADIGGTNARFGLVLQPSGCVQDVQILLGKDHASPQAAALAYLQGRKIGCAALAIAAPVERQPLQLTNSPWWVSRAEIAAALQLPVAQLTLLNDFEALAWALPGLASHDLQHIAFANSSLPLGEILKEKASTQHHFTKAILGPGTGLGVSACIPHQSGWTALATEGGHATLCAANAFEDSIIAALRPKHAHISAERLLCGTGLPLLHWAVCSVTGSPYEPLSAQQITQHGMLETHSPAHTTLSTFCAMLGTVAGNVALTLGARGGVYLAGGIAQILGPMLSGSEFRKRFEAKGRYQSYMAAIPTALICAPHAALAGAAAALQLSAHAKTARPVLSC
jgi:glucokinase